MPYGIILNGMLFSIIPIPTELTITASLLSGKDYGLIALDTGFG
jgi:hypothetical protein